MKSGFASIIGHTNAGKSTLINFLLKEKTVLVSHKQNTTGRKIKAIVMNGEDQIIFIGTPGLHESETTLNQFLIQSTIKSMGDCDVILFAANIFDSVKDYENFPSLNPKVPHIIILNRVNLADNGTLLKKLNGYAKFSKYSEAILPYSCKKRNYQKPLLNELYKLLPEHEYFYDSEFLTPSSQKDIFRESILESIYESLSEELPYSCEIMIKNTKETSNPFITDAQIITDANSHKAMLIGKDGTTLKRIGKDTRFKISKLIQNRVLLKLSVIVEKNWQKDEIFLRRILNYEE